MTMKNKTLQIKMERVLGSVDDRNKKGQIVGWSGTIKPEAGERIGKERNWLGSARLEQKDDFLHLHGQ